MRFWNYLVYDFNHTLKEKVIFGTVIFAAIITLAVCCQVRGTISDILFVLICPLLVMFYVFGVLYQASHFGLPFRNKQTSIQFLMLPVSTTEKFFSRLINQCIVPVIIALLAVALSTGLIYLVNSFVELNICNAISGGIRKVVSEYQLVPEEIKPRLKSFLSLITWLYLLIGVVGAGEMVVGSLIFGKYAFLKTFIVFSILSSMISSLFFEAQNTVVYQVNGQGNDKEMILSLFEKILSWDFFAGYTIFAIVLFVASYILFRRKTIIKTGF